MQDRHLVSNYWLNLPRKGCWEIRTLKMHSRPGYLTGHRKPVSWWQFSPNRLHASASTQVAARTPFLPWVGSGGPTRTHGRHVFGRLSPCLICCHSQTHTVDQQRPSSETLTLVGSSKGKLHDSRLLLAAIGHLSAWPTAAAVFPVFMFSEQNSSETV